MFYAKRMVYSSICAYKIHYNAKSTVHSMSYKHVSDYFFLGVRMFHLYDKMEDNSYSYAKSILEGGSYNVCIAFNRILHLNSFKDIKEVYNRIDSLLDGYNHLTRKKVLSQYVQSRHQWNTYYWNPWTRFCLGHSKLASVVIFCVGNVYALLRKCKK